METSTADPLTLNEKRITIKRISYLHFLTNCSLLLKKTSFFFCLGRFPQMVYGWLMSQGKYPSTRLYISNSKWLARWKWQTFLFRATLQLPTEHILSFINLNTDRICLDLSRAMKWSTSWTPLKVMISLQFKTSSLQSRGTAIFFRPFYFGSVCQMMKNMV